MNSQNKYHPTAKALFCVAAFWLIIGLFGSATWVIYFGRLGLLIMSSGFFYIGLGIWARRKPMPAAVVGVLLGLMLFGCALRLASFREIAGAEWLKSLIPDLLLHVPVLFLLVAAVVTARKRPLVQGPEAGEKHEVRDA
jgi:hypothetical protein